MDREYEIHAAQGGKEVSERVVFVTNRISDMQLCNHLISLFLSKQKSLEQKRSFFIGKRHLMRI